MDPMAMKKDELIEGAVQFLGMTKTKARGMSKADLAAALTALQKPEAQFEFIPSKIAQPAPAETEPTPEQKALWPATFEPLAKRYPHGAKTADEAYSRSLARRRNSRERYRRTFNRLKKRGGIRG